jgi:hypothetical protein
MFAIYSPQKRMQIGIFRAIPVAISMLGGGKTKL